MTPMTSLPKKADTARDAAQDVFFGQLTLIWARWFFIVGTTVVALWGVQTVAEMTLAIFLVAALMATNFYVHGRYMMEKPANRLVLGGISLFDMVIVLALVMGWIGAEGLRSEYHLFVYPLLFAVALVFSPLSSISFVLLTVILYAALCIALDPQDVLT